MNKAIGRELHLHVLDPLLWKTLPKSTWLKKIAIPGTEALQRMESIYYDTALRTLQRSGYALRIDGEGSERTVIMAKTDGADDDTQLNRKWLIRSTGLEPDPAIIRQISGSEKLRALLKEDEELKPIFRVKFNRWRVMVEPQIGAKTFEIALDKGTITTGEKDEDIFEVGVKLKNGTQRDLLMISFELARRFPLYPEELNPYHRGLRLLNPTNETQVPASPWPLSASAFLMEATEAVWKAQKAYFASPKAVDELHDLRIALRKLRSRLSFAAFRYSPEEVKRMKVLLQVWSGLTASIRELDVLRKEWVIAAERCGCDVAASHLAESLLIQRTKQSEPLHKALHSGKLTANVLELCVWSFSEAKNDEVSLEWKDYSIKRLKKWLKDLSRRLKSIDSNDTELMHDLRIRVKKTRYILERYASGQENKSVKILLATLKLCQESLGDIQDSVQGRRMLEAMKPKIKAANRDHELACMIGWQARREFDASLRFKCFLSTFRKKIKHWLRERQ